MINKSVAISIFIILYFTAINCDKLYSQKSDSCKVLIPELIGDYEGNCKDGLANGKGSATGEDSYTGMFKDGKPDGKGKYVYKNGNSFTGNWTDGVKNGSGKFVFYVDGKVNVQTGYWENGEYIGATKPMDYRVTNKIGVEEYSIKKEEGNEDYVSINFFLSMTKYIPSDLQMEVSSGEIKQDFRSWSMLHYSLPVTCEINYTLRIADTFKVCRFTFEILKPGKYKVDIRNN
ncbi:MAG: hypothetical protein ACM3PX_06160 [Omnitrophica WOR_2 bacterium]|jgi:hypothetical protein